MSATERLFHFTCGDHGFPGIGKRGLLMPPKNRTLFGISHVDIGVVWLTTGGFEATGMAQSGYATCKQWEYRYIVTDASTCEPWLTSKAREVLAKEEIIPLVEALEQVGDPTTWWVSSEPVPVRLG